MITIISGGGGHARLAKGICEGLEDLGVKFNVFHTGSKLEKEWFKVYKNYSILRPNLPLKKTSPLRWIKGVLKVFPLRKKIGEYVISSGASLSFLVSAIGKLTKNSKIINFEVPDRIKYNSSTFIKLSKFSALDIVSWREQKIKYKTKVLNGVVVPKPITKRKRGKFVLISTGTTPINREYLQEIVNIVNGVGEKAVVLYRGNEKIENANVIRELVPQNEMEELIANSKLVISHPGYTAVEAAINYGKPVHLITIKDYTKGPQEEDAKLLAKKINLSYGNLNEKTIKKAIKKKPKNKNANKRFKKIISQIIQD